MSSSALSQGVVISALEPSAQANHPELRYTRWLPIADRRFSFEASKDLIAWSPTMVLEVSALRSDTSERVTAREQAPLAGKECQFLRLRVD